MDFLVRMGMNCVKCATMLRPLTSAFGKNDRVTQQDHSLRRTDHDVDAGVRPARPLVAFDACCRDPCNRPSGSSGAVASESALGGPAGAGNFSVDCHQSVPHACRNGRASRCVWLGLRRLPHRVDHSECHLHVRHELRDWAIQGPAGKLDGHYPGSPLAAASNRVFLRSFF
jgi:hypothetical protein